MKNDIPDYQVGQRFPTDNKSHIRIMAIAWGDGYIMARFAGCVPFCESFYDFKERLKKVELKLKSSNSGK